MSVREEDRRKNACPSRGLGLAAAAMGVGVGAALYCFFSKGNDQQDTEGSTSEEWECEQPQTLDNSASSYNSDYTTVSEHSTTDTSIIDTDNNFHTCTRNCNGPRCGNNSYCNTNMRRVISIDSDVYDDEMSITDSDDDSVIVSDDYSDDDFESTSEGSETENGFSDSENGSTDSEESEGYETLATTTNSNHNGTESFETDDPQESNDWDVTNSSVGIPSPVVPSLLYRITDYLTASPNRRNRLPSEDEQMRILQEQAFRERKWSLEECSVCFEVMLRDQELMSLPCTHNFHVGCIGPWLQQHQTCPVCRKPVE